MENTNLIDQEQAFEESKEKIFELLEEKKYFRCRDELLKFNAVDIAELLEEVMRKYSMQTAIILFRTLPRVLLLRYSHTLTLMIRLKSSILSLIPRLNT